MHTIHEPNKQVFVNLTQSKELASSEADLLIRVIFSDLKLHVDLFRYGGFLVNYDVCSLGKETLHNIKAARKVDRRRA